MKTLEKRAQAAMGRLVGRGRTTRIPDEVRAATRAIRGSDLGSPGGCAPAANRWRILNFWAT